MGAAAAPLAAALGLIGWTLAQARLLESRHPVAPLAFYLVGLALLIPALLTLADEAESRRGEPESRLDRTRRAWLTWDVLALPVLMLLAVVMQTSAPPNFAQRDTAPALAFVQTTINLDWGAVFVVLLVPAVYLLGRALDTPLTGVLAAALAAVSGWPAALAQTGPVYLALAGGAAISLALLPRAVYRLRTLAAWAALIAVGYIVVSPLLAVLALLVPVVNGLSLLDERTFARPQMVFSGAAVLLALLFIFVFAPALTPTSLTQAVADGLSPALTLLDALSASLLLFNLSGDPNPLHGLANRPVFAPPLAALFVFGLLIWAVRLRQSRRWLEVFPLAALLVALLPSALSAPFPDAQRAALALPVAVWFAAYGAVRLIRLLVRRLGSLGAAVALWLMLAAVVVTALDAGMV